MQGIKSEFLGQGLHKTMHLLLQCYKESFGSETWRLVLWIMALLSGQIESEDGQNVFNNFVLLNADRFLELIRTTQKYNRKGSNLTDFKKDLVQLIQNVYKSADDKI